MLKKKKEDGTNRLGRIIHAKCMRVHYQNHLAQGTAIEALPNQDNHGSVRFAMISLTTESLTVDTGEVDGGSVVEKQER